MNQPNLPRSPLEEADHMYYVYHSRLFPTYRLAGTSTVTMPAYAGSAGYDFSSDLFTRQSFPRPQTVEDVIHNGYFAVPRGRPETAVISDKKHTSRLGLDDVVGQIRNRYELYEKNIYDLEVAKCAAINTVYEHEARHGPTNSKVEYSMNKRLDNLYRDQREERVNLWRDVSRLRLLLPENAQQYLTAYRKMAILYDDKGGLP